MFIPNYPILIGTKVTLLVNCSNFNGKFEAGTKMTIFGENRLGYELVDNFGNRITGIKSSSFIAQQFLAENEN